MDMIMDISSVAYERKDNNTIVYTSFPLIHELCCVICQTDFIEVQDSSSKSNFHWQTMKCRLLIHVVPDIIASPKAGTETSIIIITHKDYLETEKLNRILRHFKLVYQGTQPISIDLYKKCLIFTIQTKIAPLWNKIGHYFLRGKEFYYSIKAIEALKLDILVEEKNICLKLHAEKIRIPCIKLEDYLSSFEISKFLADPKGYVDLSHYNLPFVYVLPSTKKGKLISISKQIPTECPFKDYMQLRRHWKNMYGYSLPKSQDQILFYQIKFLIPKSNVFTYPNVCITSAPLDIVLNRDKELTIKYFLSNMLQKLPVICGKQLQMSRNTPIKMDALKVNLATNVLSQNQEQNTHFAKRNIPNSILQSCSSESKKCRYSDSAPKSIELTKIRQIHNTPFSENRTISNNNNIYRNQNDATDIYNSQTTNPNCIQSNISEGSSTRLTIISNETISKHFKIHKAQSFANSEKFTQKAEQKHSTLKEKLVKAKSNDNSKESS